MIPIEWFLLIRTRRMQRRSSQMWIFILIFRCSRSLRHRPQMENPLFPRNYIGQTHLPILHRLMILVRPIRQALDTSSQMVRRRSLKQKKCVQSNQLVILKYTRIWTKLYFGWMDTAGAMTNLLIIIQTVNIVCAMFTLQKILLFM